MNILAIETSCDETAIAVLKAGGKLKMPRVKVLKNIVFSQIPFHAPFGGVVPNIAKREHIAKLPLLFLKIKKFLDRKKIKIDIIGVTVGPGLEPALWTGINFAKFIGKNFYPSAEILGVNHIEGHLYSFLINEKLKSRLKFPAVALIVSGGHTILLFLESLFNYRVIGETRDDAAGEVFDKVGRMLGLPYPGGPAVEKAAVFGDKNFYEFPRPMIFHKNYDFSFSGLKTSVFYFLKKIKFKKDPLKNKKLISDVAASFQAAAVEVLVYKTIKAAKELGAKSVIISGGVAANESLRKSMKMAAKNLKINFIVSPKKFNTDNASMIGAACYVQFLKGKKTKLVARSDFYIG
jgi:N6-L-threonylcarbamoyladenine synthase